MEVSAARLNMVRVSLALLTAWWFVFGIAGVFLPQRMLEPILAEPFTPGLHAIASEQGAVTLAWAVAFAIALRDPLRHRGLMQAILANLVIFFVVEVYVTLAFGANWPQAPIWVSNALLIVLAAVVAVAYPWRSATTQER